MAGLSTIFSIIRPSTTIASLTSDSPSRPPPPPKRKKHTKTGRKVRDRSPQLRKRRSDKPSVLQIERAIGAGSYRDSETGEMDERNSVLDALLIGYANKFEGPVEKKIREISEAFVNRTESKFRSSGKTLLMVAVQWILPIWTMSLLVASGVVKLPFNLPFLDDLIM